MEWTVVTVIVVLCGLIAVIAKPLLSFNTTVTKLKDSVDSLNKEIERIAEKNDESHDRLWDKTKVMDDKIGDHETRIVVLENRGA
jgi:uncharacterized membrane protein (DUF106 family)